jgi:hypothetical protein
VQEQHLSATSQCQFQIIADILVGFYRQCSGRGVRVLAQGQRVQEGTPQSPWQTLTLFAALTTRGLEAPMTIPEPTDGDIFLAYGEQVLGPRDGRQSKRPVDDSQNSP